MNHAKLLHMLNDKIANDANSAQTRTILRFRSPEFFADCLSGLEEMRCSYEHLRDIHAIESIHALVCPLHFALEPALFDNQLMLEEDTSIRLHVRGFNPMNPAQFRHMPKNFDIKHKIPWGVKQIKAPLVWKKSTGSRIKIGVVDTGADFNHPDLKSSLSRGVNLLNRFSAPFDDNGHGTHIAGTIAAFNQQQQGMTGVAPKAMIYPIKAFDRYGSAYVSDIIMGIDWCVTNQMDIINMSFGMHQRSQSLLDAVTAAYHAGVVIVSSSGNDGKQNFIDYPARFPQTIAVGATNRKNRITTFTNRGKQIDVYAPGAQIYSTWIGGKYNELSGTSMATSHVTGLIALMKAYNPKLTPKRIKQVLKYSTVPIRTPANKPSSIGMIQAVKALNRLKTRRATRKKAISSRISRR